MTTSGLAQRVRMTPLARREARRGLLFLTPWLIGFTVFTAFPIVASLAFSFSNITLAQEEPLRFVGLENFQRFQHDAVAWNSLAVTFKFALVWLPLSIVLPFVIALALNSRHARGSMLFRVLFFMPYVVPFVAGVLVWQAMLGPNGWINEFLAWVGILDLNIAGWEPFGGKAINFLNDTTAIYPALAIMGLWGIGAGIIINLAGLRGIPTEYYDAARIDGAGAWGQLRHITIPMMTPIIFYSLILGIIGVMQYFLVPLVLGGSGDPGGSTLFYNLYLYKQFFTFQNMSYGATLAWVLFGIILAITLVVFWSARRWVFYAGER
jgi:multiple sugar transport system permease protein